MTRMQARFLALWSRSGGTDAEQAYADLARCYAEPTRHYHTLQHVRRCLRDLDWARAEIPDIDAVELALWCHDLIYVPGAEDNEQRSAGWLRHWSGNRIGATERIAGLILDTAHAGIPATLAGRFTVDIDLAVLGCTRTRFRRNGVLLRAERPDLDELAYDAAERAFLCALLARPRIYHTDLFHDRYEAHARANLAWRLAQPAPGLRETRP
jgi:predicted metal-dependent HD superfamily phosphohydrolase